jgi:hypothetical protein
VLNSEPATEPFMMFNSRLEINYHGLEFVNNPKHHQLLAPSSRDMVSGPKCIGYFLSFFFLSLRNHDCNTNIEWCFHSVVIYLTVLFHTN